MPKAFRVFLSVFLLLLAIEGCGDGGSEPSQQVTLALYNFPGTATLHVALDKGYFRDMGLDVSVKSFESGRLALDAAMSGEADFATVADTPIARAVLDGESVAIIATTCRIERAISIVARRDRGISSFSDLKGKKVGMAEGSVSEFALYAYLLAYDVNPNDVQIVSVSPDDFVDALPDGDVDAISLASPHRVLVQERLGENAVVLDDPSVAVSTMNLVVTREFAEGNRQQIEKFLRALLRANQYIEQNLDEVRQISMNLIGPDSPLYDSEWPNYRFEVALDQSLIIGLEDEARWMIGKTGSGREVPNFLGSINVEALRAVQPDAVRIVGE